MACRYHHLIKPLHLLELLGIDIEKILLDRRIGNYPHDDNTGLLVLKPLPVDLKVDF